MSVDWHSLFVPSGSVLEIVVRGTVMYVAILALMRIIPRRQTGTLGVTDVLLITLLADASQHGLAGEYQSITEGIVLVATIMFWSFALDWLAYHSRTVASLIEPPPLPLIKNGRIQWANLRRELITKDALLGHLREQGISDVSKVKEAYMESEGAISVVQKPERRHSGHESAIG